VIGSSTACVKCGITMMSCVGPATCRRCANPEPAPEPASAENANDVQIGGDHYRKVPGEQHWDRVWRLFGPGYFVGNITAYVERYQDKNGIEDLRKAKHYIEKLIELETAKLKEKTDA